MTLSHFVFAYQQVKTLLTYFVTIIPLVLCYPVIGSSTESHFHMTDAEIDQWMTTSTEKWQYRLSGLWPDVIKMAGIVYGPAKKGNVRAQLTFAYFVVLTKNFKDDTKLSGLTIDEAVGVSKAWLAELTTSPNKEVSFISRKLLRNLELR